jgi:hypothetical protein
MINLQYSYLVRYDVMVSGRSDDEASMYLRNVGTQLNKIHDTTRHKSVIFTIAAA